MQDLARFDIKACDGLCLVFIPALPDEQLAALRDAVAQVQVLMTITTKLVLFGLTMSDDITRELNAVAAAGWETMDLLAFDWPVAAAVSAPLPPIHSLSLLAPLSSSLLSQVLQCVPSVERMAVPGIQLTTAVPAGTVLPWQTLAVMQLDLLAWPRQTDLVGPTQWEVGACSIELTPEQVRTAPT